MLEIMQCRMLALLACIVFLRGVLSAVDSRLFFVTSTGHISYGIQTAAFAKTGSFIKCCTICTTQPTCLSVLYNTATSDCLTNRGTANVTLLPTPSGWKYAEIANRINVPTTPFSTSPVPTNLVPTSQVQTIPLQTTVTTQVPTTPMPTTLVPTTLAVTTVSTPCLTTGDCTVPNSICDTATSNCKCVPGYSFDGQVSQCVTACSSYGTTFQPDLGKGFSGYGDITLSGLTLDQCKSACITETSITCRVAEYKSGSQQCQLYINTALQLTSVYITVSGVDLYQRDCA